MSPHELRSRVVHVQLGIIPCRLLVEGPCLHIAIDPTRNIDELEHVVVGTGVDSPTTACLYISELNRYLKRFLAFELQSTLSHLCRCRSREDTMNLLTIKPSLFYAIGSLLSLLLFGDMSESKISHRSRFTSVQWSALKQYIVMYT
jgi:hypothetical protein